MKRLGFFVAVCLAFASVHLAAQDKKVNTTVFTSRYAVDIDYRDPAKWLFGSVLGMGPSHVTYEETVVTDSADEHRTHLRLAENADDPWFDIYEDTNLISLTHFPRSEKQRLGKDAATLVERLLPFLSCRSSCDSILTGSLHVDTSKILATFTVREHIEIPDQERIVLRGTATRYVDAFTRDGGTETPYISGNVVIERINGHTIYPYISAYLFDENVRIKLYLQSFSVDYR